MKPAQPTKTTQGHMEERRRGTQNMVAKLMAERTKMLTLFCRLAGLEPFEEAKNHTSTQKLLQQFCQLLVDYIAAGHFGLYERIVNGTERRGGLATLAEELYPRIAASTEVALDFNDRYDCEDHCDLSPEFESDLSRLGEELAARIELEDKLLAQLLYRR